MKRMGVVLAGLTVAVCPAVIGLWANASFSEAVPVRVPASGQVIRLAATPTPSVSPSASPSASDDHGGRTPRDQRTEPGDDRRTGTSGSSGSRTRHNDDTTADDHGGRTPRDSRTEAGDDRRTSGSDDSSSSDDSGRSGRSGGSDDTQPDDHGGHGGHGGDD